MQKLTSPGEKHSGRPDNGYKPWPLNREAEGHKTAVDAVNLHSRFNPRLVGFGIVGPPIGISERAEDGRPNSKDLQDSCSRNSEELK